MLPHPPPPLGFVSAGASQSHLVNLLESREDLRGGCVVRHDPQRKHEGEEREDMQEQHNSFGKWQVMGEEDVEANGEEYEEEHHERCLPEHRYVRVGIHQYDHCLDYAGEL